MHTYPKQFEPTVEVGRCDKPTRSIEQRDVVVVSTFCSDGHHIKSKIYPTEKKAHAVMKRLQRWVDLSLQKGE